MALSERINKLFDNDSYSEARKLLRAALRREPRHHWLLTRLSTTYYEQRRYAKALKVSRRALELAPQCPLVLWDHAGNLEMTGDVRGAISIYKKLLRRGVRSIAYGTCGEGLKWGRALVNDCRYRLALCLAGSDKKKQAIRWIRAHLSQRGKNSPSIYTSAEVKKKLKRLSAEVPKTRA